MSMQAIRSLPNYPIYLKLMIEGKFPDPSALRTQEGEELIGNIICMFRWMFR